MENEGGGRTRGRILRPRPGLTADEAGADLRSAGVLVSYLALVSIEFVRDVAVVLAALAIFRAWFS